MSATNDDILRHYEHGGLLERILAGLEAAAKELSALTHEDLAPADEFHPQGRIATKALAKLGQVTHRNANSLFQLEARKIQGLNSRFIICVFNLEWSRASDSPGIDAKVYIRPWSD